MKLHFCPNNWFSNCLCLCGFVLSCSPTRGAPSTLVACRFSLTMQLELRLHLIYQRQMALRIGHWPTYGNDVHTLCVASYQVFAYLLCHYTITPRTYANTFLPVYSHRAGVVNPAPPLHWRMLHVGQCIRFVDLHTRRPFWSVSLHSSCNVSSTCLAHISFNFQLSSQVIP